MADYFYIGNNAHRIAEHTPRHSNLLLYIGKANIAEHTPSIKIGIQLSIYSINQYYNTPIVCNVSTKKYIYIEVTKKSNLGIAIYIHMAIIVLTS